MDGWMDDVLGLDFKTLFCLRFDKHFTAAATTPPPPKKNIRKKAEQQEITYSHTH
eukprot:m.103128 g.103128  ORF g.103128 m.103128 type:complete len:55 (+) comp9088_c14_seq1:3-167(+)